MVGHSRVIKVEESFLTSYQGSDTKNPNILPVEDVMLFENQFGMKIGQRLKRGRYGVVYQGELTDAFSLDKLTSYDKFHYFHCKTTNADYLKSGQKFAMKFSDIEKRKAYSIVDIEERVQHEIKFIQRVEYDDECCCVRAFFVLAVTPVRYYIFMEQADTNLQCLISDYCTTNRLLNNIFVIDLYECLVRTVRRLHEQKMTYGMMRTSNILIFYNAGDDKPFNIKICDFVRSIQTNPDETSLSVIDDAVEQDLDDLFYIHYEIFAMTRFNFSKYQAFKELLKMMTDINAHQNSIQTLDKLLQFISKFKYEQANQ